MSHHLPRLEDRFLTRREMLSRCGMGFASLGFANLMASSGEAANVSTHPLSPKGPHFPGKAKRVIHIFANGGASHVDTFDPKPALAANAGKPLR